MPPPLATVMQPSSYLPLGFSASFHQSIHWSGLFHQNSIIASDGASNGVSPGLTTGNFRIPNLCHFRFHRKIGSSLSKSCNNDKDANCRNQYSLHLVLMVYLAMLSLSCDYKSSSFIMASILSSASFSTKS